MKKDLDAIFKAKQAHRRKLAAKPIDEKLRIVEELARRTLAIRASTKAKPEDSSGKPKKGGKEE